MGFGQMTRLTVPKTYKLYIGGKFPRSESGRTYEVVSKKGAFLANAALASRKDARDAVVAARAAQPGPRPNGEPATPRFKVDDGARYESGGGGMMSTIEDYLRFTAALANGGASPQGAGGKRIIGKQTLAFMTADHTLARPGRPPGLGFGLGFEVRTRVGDSALPGSVGEYGWAGNAGTVFWIDPKKDLTAIYMVQVSDPDRVALRNQFRTMVQAAIID